MMEPSRHTIFLEGANLAQADHVVGEIRPEDNLRGIITFSFHFFNLTCFHFKYLKGQSFKIKYFLSFRLILNPLLYGSWWPIVAMSLSIICFWIGFVKLCYLGCLTWLVDLSGCWSFKSWQHQRSYQKAYRIVTMDTHGGFYNAAQLGNQAVITVIQYPL